MASFTSLSVMLCVLFYVSAVVSMPKIQKRIIGGQDADSGQFKYMVGISPETVYQQWFICGGAIIHENFILTSAGCAEDYVERPEKLNAILGSPKYDSDDEYPSVGISGIVLHPEYNSEFIYNDIAILRTEQPMEFNHAVGPIALPGLDVTSENDINAVFTGWGLLEDLESLGRVEIAKNLQYQEAKTLRFSDCVAEYVLGLNPTDQWKDVGPRFGDSKKFCTRNQVGHGLCVGDFGSPLVADDTLIGIASWSEKGLPDVYTNVYAHINWIQYELRRA